LKVRNEGCRESGETHLNIGNGQAAVGGLVILNQRKQTEAILVESSIVVVESRQVPGHGSSLKEGEAASLQLDWQPSSHFSGLTAINRCIGREVRQRIQSRAGELSPERVEANRL
jgi:hypothetical protein